MAVTKRHQKFLKVGEGAYAALVDRQGRMQTPEVVARSERTAAGLEPGLTETGRSGLDTYIVAETCRSDISANTASERPDQKGKVGGATLDLSELPTTTLHFSKLMILPPAKFTVVNQGSSRNHRI